MFVKFDMNDVLDLRLIYDKIKNKQNIWIMIRFCAIMIDIIHDVSLEIHMPRNTTEMFSYTSDKYWAKIINGLDYLENNPHPSKHELLNKIHLGSKNNLIVYWYPILTKLKHFNQYNLQSEINYYCCSLQTILELKEKKNNLIFNTLLSIDQIICEAIWLIHKSKLQIYACYTLLKLITPEYIDSYVLEKYYIYLISHYDGPCIETENRIEIVNLIKFDN